MNSTRRWVRAARASRGVHDSFSRRGAPRASAQQKPKVRTITAFVRLDPGRYEQQVATTLAFLQKAKDVYERAGFEVETLRLVTQPFPRFTQDMTPEASMAFFTRLDALAAKDDLEISVGPAMLLDSDNPLEAERLGQVLARRRISPAASSSPGRTGFTGAQFTPPPASSSISRTTRRTAKGTSALPRCRWSPNTFPFFPAAYHDGFGRQFAIGVESANVVAEVLAKRQPPYEMHQALVAQLENSLNSIDGLGNILDDQTGWDFMGIDLSPAPSKDASIGAAIEAALGGTNLVPRHAFDRGLDYRRPWRHHAQEDRLFRRDAARAGGSRPRTALGRGRALAQ